MDLLLKIIIWSLALLTLWKVYLFITWNIERAVFFGSVGAFVKDKKKPVRKIRKKKVKK